MNFRKLEHGFRTISAGISYTLPEGHEDSDIQSFWLLLYTREVHGVVIGRVVSRVATIMTHIRGLITPLITTQ